MLNIYRSTKLLHQEIKKHVFSVNLFKCSRRRCHDDLVGVTNGNSLDGGKNRKIAPTNEQTVKSSEVASDGNMVLDVTMGVRTTTTTTTSRRVSNSSVPEDHIRLAEIIWDYMLMNDTLTKSDLILVLGNNDVRVAKHAAQLWLDGYAEYIMISGHLGNLTEGYWTRPEYEVFREIALNMGVPSDRILVETKATNTGQNVRLSYEVLSNRTNGEVNGGTSVSLLPLQSVILVQTPYMERRTYATFMKQWPGDKARIRVQVTSPKVYLRQYPNSEVGSMQDTICILLGCFQRILLYPAKGYQIQQHVPDNVVEAYNGLTDVGLYERFLSKS